MARRPTELRFKEHHDSLCKGGRGLPASGTTSPGAVTGKPPSLALTAPSDKAPGLHPLRGGFRRAQASPCQTSGGADTRDPERRDAPRPHPRSPLSLVPLQTHLPRAPQNTPPPPALPIFLSEGTKERQERNPRRAIPRSAHSPSSERGTEGLQSPQRHDSAAPQRRTGCHSPMRSPGGGGGPQGAGFRGITETPESGALGSGGTPQLLSVAVAGGNCEPARTEGTVEPRRGLCPSARRPGRNPFLQYRYRCRRRSSRTPLPPRLPLPLPLPLPPPPSWQRVAAECCHPP